MLSVGSNEQRHQHADSRAVHVLEPGEVQHQSLGSTDARILVSRHQRCFAGRRDISLDVDHRGAAADVPNVHRNQRFCHVLAPPEVPSLTARVALSTSANSLMKSESLVISKMWR